MRNFQYAPALLAKCFYNEWRNIGANYLLVGSSRLQADNRYEITFELLSLDRQTRILGEKMTVPAEKWRDAAHFISDKVFEKIIGIKGAFSTRILYVNQYYSLGKRRYRLELSDADGHRPISILDSPEPILSPAGLPMASKLPMFLLRIIAPLFLFRISPPNSAVY